MTEAEALERLISMVQSDADPVLTYGDVATLMRVAVRPDEAGNPVTNVVTAPTWAASTSYSYGDVVTPAPAVGRYWQCVNAATSGGTQPDWPNQVGRPPFVTTVIDDDLVWLDVGTTWSPTYDLNAAAAEGWRLKAGRVAGRFDFTTDGQTFQRGQLLAHCRDMERTYRRRIALGV